MPPPSKRRKISSATKYSKPITRPSTKTTSTTKTPTEDPVYDPTAREDYLSGFRKRKQQRIKHAREEAKKKDRELKIESRKHIREQRQKDLEEHVSAVNDILKRSREGDSDVEEQEADGEVDNQVSPNGVEDEVQVAKAELPRHEDEYIDEEKYTTVTIKPMDESDAAEEESKDSDSDDDKDESKADRKPKAKPTIREIVLPDGTIKKKRIWTKDKPTGPKQKKKKVKKFRYESKVERKATRSKQRASDDAAAKTRREAGKS